MIGLLFSGQGAQKTGLTQDLYNSIPQYRHIIDEAGKILDQDLAALLYDPFKATDLASTRFCQSAILAISYGLYQLIKDSLPKEKFGIGLSLGEYSALAASKQMNFKTALQLTKRRGELMQQASDMTASKMLAVIKTDLTDIESACNDVGLVQVANVNTPDQVVVGGPVTAVDQVSAILASQGKRTLEFNVSGAFHTLVMQPAQERLYGALKQVNWQLGTFPVYSTTTQEEFLPDMITDNLTKQLISTTYFAKTLEEHNTGLTAVIELGPGKTLTSFARKIISGIKTYRTDSYAALNKTISGLETM